MEADRDAWEPVGVAESNGGRGLLRNQQVETEPVVGRVAGNPFVVGSECLAPLCSWSWKSFTTVVVAVLQGYCCRGQQRA